MTHDNLPYWLAAIYFPRVGPGTFLRWLEQFSDIKTLFQASKDELIAKGISAEYIQKWQEINGKYIEKDLAWARGDDCHIISIESESYPSLLKEISNPPLILFVHGDVTVLQQIQIAMVGSRSATQTGLKNAEQFAYAIAEAGIAVTSGLALGIDGASHRGALTAKGITIGVCGTGLNHIYPPSHLSLVNDIVQHRGAVISEFPLFTVPRAVNFPRRNRVIAGLSIGVVVIEAALKSGSLITAKYALEQGREVFAVPGSIHNPLAKGCHSLLRQGAKLVETATDIFEELAHYQGCDQKQKNNIFTTTVVTGKNTSPPKQTLLLEQQQLLEQIGYEITSLDMIVLRSGLTAGEVSSILLILELNGYIQSVPGGYVRVILD
ncbi:MAG: DNA-processing protein DprA [Gammaproteobacteria bacterium]|nr:DNA-processing protein DprA [Gammaproteobacteria bacterium]MCW5584076.1 DNA-processing protein DprA [Gammaproteobacteria bacterium]